MTEVEYAVRDALHAALAGEPDVTGTAYAVRRRARRRTQARLAIAAALVPLTATGAVAALALLPHRDQEPVRPVAGSVALRPPPPGERDCGPDDLTFRVTGGAAAFHAAGFDVVGRHVGPTPCRLTVLSVRVTPPEGAEDDFVTGDGAQDADVHPGDVLLLRGGTTNLCAAFDLRLSVGDGPAVTAGQVPGAACPTGYELDVRSVTLRLFAAVPAGDPRTLHADLRVPDRATAGADLAYQVVLTNPTDTPVPLSPCPSYALTMNGALTGGTLDCAALPARVDAYGSVTATLHLTVPPDARAKALFLHWAWAGLETRICPDDACGRPELVLDPAAGDQAVSSTIL